MKFSLVFLTALVAGAMASPANTGAFTFGSDVSKSDVTTHAFNLRDVVERSLTKRDCAACPANPGSCNYQADLNACNCKCNGSQGQCQGGPNCGADAKACVQQCSCGNFSC